MDTNDSEMCLINSQIATFHC